VASRLTNYTAFAIKPRASSITIRRFDAVYLDESTFILVLVASNGQVKTKTVRLTDMEPLSMTVTDLLAATCNEHLQNLSANDINLPIMMEMEKAMGSRAELVSVVVKVIYEAMNELDQGELKVSGMDRLLQYPEFNDPDRMKEVLGAIEQKDDILRMVSAPGDEGINGIGVVIGSESAVKVMDNSALVYKPIVQNGKTVGAIGVLGPARMDYAKVLATLEGISGNVESLLSPEQKQLQDGGHTSPSSDES
jgi:heat-inducible transcriptional repressor